MIQCIWTEWAKKTSEFKSSVLGIRERILAKTKNHPTASCRIQRVDTTVCTMISLQVCVCVWRFCVPVRFLLLLSG